MGTRWNTYPNKKKYTKKEEKNWNLQTIKSYGTKKKASTLFIEILDKDEISLSSMGEEFKSKAWEREKKRWDRIYLWDFMQKRPLLFLAKPCILNFGCLDLNGTEPRGVKIKLLWGDGIRLKFCPCGWIRIYWVRVYSYWPDPNSTGVQACKEQ